MLALAAEGVDPAPLEGISEVMNKVRVLIYVVIGAFLLGAAVVGYIACRCDRAPTYAASQHFGAPPGWVAPTELTTPWLPFATNEASEVTAGFPAGSKVVRLELEGGEVVDVGILPGGQVVTREGIKATIFVKREALIAGQVRPFFGVGGVGPDPDYAVALGVDVLRVWKVNVGVGALINDDAVAGAAFAAYPVWRNVDVRAGGGFGTAGAVGYFGASIAITK